MPPQGRVCPPSVRKYSANGPDRSQMIPKHGLARYVGERLRVASVPDTPQDGGSLPARRKGEP